MPKSYHEQPDEVFTAATPAPLAVGFSFNDSQPPPDPDFKEAGGRSPEEPRFGQQSGAGLRRGLAPSTFVTCVAWRRRLYSPPRPAVHLIAAGLHDKMRRTR
jgi:hypothetical protein